MGFPGGTSGKEPACQCRKHETWFDPRVGKSGWRWKWQLTAVFLPMDRGAWRATVHRLQSWTQMKQRSTHTEVLSALEQLTLLHFFFPSLKWIRKQNSFGTCSFQSFQLNLQILCNRDKLSSLDSIWISDSRKVWQNKMVALNRLSTFEREREWSNSVVSNSLQPHRL